MTNAKLARRDAMRARRAAEPAAEPLDAGAIQYTDGSYAEAGDDGIPVLTQQADDSSAPDLQERMEALREARSDVPADAADAADDDIQPLEVGAVDEDAVEGDTGEAGVADDDELSFDGVDVQTIDESGKS